MLQKSLKATVCFSPYAECFFRGSQVHTSRLMSFTLFHSYVQTLVLLKLRSAAWSLIPRRSFFDPLPDHAGHRWDPNLFVGGFPRPVCQPRASVSVEMHPRSAR